MACCSAMFERCAPDGETVIGLLDAETGMTTWHTATNPSTTWIGDPATLTKCGAGSGSTSTSVFSGSTNPDGSTTLYHDDGLGNVTTVVIPAPAGGTGSTSSFAGVVNADGSVTLTHDAGDGTAPTVFVIPADDVHVPSSMTVTPQADGSLIVTHNNGEGVITSFTVPAGAADTFTTFVTLPDGTVQFTDPDGNQVILCADCGPSVFTWAPQADGSILVTHDDGQGTVVSGTIAPGGAGGSTSTVTPTVLADGSVLYTHDDGLGNTTEWTISPAAADTFTTFVTLADGTVQFTDPDGNQVSITPHPPHTPSSFTWTANPDGTIAVTHDDGAGNVTNGIIPASAGETITTLVPGPTPGTYIYTNEAGQAVTIDTNQIDADINNVTVAGSVMTFSNEDGSSITVDICQIVNDNCGSSVIVNADGSISITQTDGSTATVAAPATSAFTAVTNADGSTTLTHNDGAGNVVVATIPAGSTSSVTPTVLADGSVLYTHDDGNGNTTEWTIAPASAPSALVDGTNSFTHDDGNGTTVTVAQALVEPDAGTNTGTVTDSEGNTQTFITSLVEACTGDDIVPATDQVVTVEALLASGRGLMVAWAPSANPCIPTTPSCPEIPGHTTNPATGERWTWDGAAWTSDPEIDFVTGRSAATAGDVSLAGFLTVPNQIEVLTDPVGCTTIENPLCRPITVRIDYGRHYQFDVADADDGMFFRIWQDYSFDGGVTWGQAEHDAWRTEYDINPVDQPVTTHDVTQDVGWSYTERTIPALGSLTVCTRLSAEFNEAVVGNGLVPSDPRTKIIAPQVYLTWWGGPTA